MFDILFNERHTHLLRDFIQAKGSTAEAIVTASAYHRATDFMINHIKRLEGLTDEQILVCSILGSCYDEDSFHKIVADLAAQGYQPDIEKNIAALYRLLTPQDKAQFANIMLLFGLERLGQSDHSTQVNGWTTSASAQGTER